MDLQKIGRFIAACRKKQGLTQMQLAERLNITDRAVSKWERGKSLPDPSIMLELCEVLSICVNELLCGEELIVEDYKKKSEQLLIDAAREKYQTDKHLLMLEIVIGLLSGVILVGGCAVAAYAAIPEWSRYVIVGATVVVSVVGFLFAARIEQTVGYYECKHCGHRYVPTLKAFYAAMHIGRTRYMRCPKCNKCSWQKKVLEKNED